MLLSDVVLVRIFDIHEQTRDIGGVDINVLGVDTHNRREERSRKRKHHQNKCNKYRRKT
jgi:hypothetical protein